MTAERWFLLNFLGIFRKKIEFCLQDFRFISIFAPKNATPRRSCNGKMREKSALNKGEKKKK